MHELTEPPFGALALRSAVNGRENNEDIALAVDIGHGMLLNVVLDGMGGCDHGEDAAEQGGRRFVLSVFEQLRLPPQLCDGEQPQTSEEERARDALLQALRQSSSHISRMVKANGWDKAGAAIAAALVTSDCAILANLGDTRGYHFAASQQKLTQCTVDHNVAGILLRAGLITPRMARYHEGRGRLEFFLGSAGFPEDPPVTRIPLSDDDAIILCTDGVYGELTNQQISEILASAGPDLDNAAGRLLAAAIDAGETDNQTVLIWRKTGSTRGKIEVADDAPPAGAGAMKE